MTDPFQTRNPQLIEAVVAVIAFGPVLLALAYAVEFFVPLLIVVIAVVAYVVFIHGA